MKKFNLNNFTKGWIIGDFNPNIWKTKDFEFSLKKYKKGDTENKHFHAIADEITIIVSGKFKMNDQIFGADDIIWILPNETVDFECLEDGATAVIKKPSSKNDKYTC